MMLRLAVNLVGHFHNRMKCRTPMYISVPQLFAYFQSERASATVDQLTVYCACVILQKQRRCPYHTSSCMLSFLSLLDATLYLSFGFIMSSRSFVLIMFVILLVGSASAACPTNWTVHSRDCCSPTFGFNSSAPTFRVAQGAEFPMNFIVWNDSSRNSLSIDTDWTTLNILWGERTSSESGSYGPNGLVDAVRIFHQPGKGLYGLQFHDLSGAYCETKKKKD